MKFRRLKRALSHKRRYLQEFSLSDEELTDLYDNKNKRFVSRVGFLHAKLKPGSGHIDDEYVYGSTMFVSRLSGMAYIPLLLYGGSSRLIRVDKYTKEVLLKRLRSEPLSVSVVF